MIPPTPFRLVRTRVLEIVVVTDQRIYYTNIYQDTPVVEYLDYPNIKNIRYNVCIYVLDTNGYIYTVWTGRLKEWYRIA